MGLKFRNKKTGEIADLDDWTLTGANDYITIESDHDREKTYNYKSLAEFLEEWEDYEPKEPLIRHEKIRKAVRAWADADDLDNFRVQNQHFNDCKIIGYTAGINKASFIGFQTTIANADNKKLYTIAELCGEDEK